MPCAGAPKLCIDTAPDKPTKPPAKATTVESRERLPSASTETSPAAAIFVCTPTIATVRLLTVPTSTDAPTPAKPPARVPVIPFKLETSLALITTF